MLDCMIVWSGYCMKFVICIDFYALNEPFNKDKDIRYKLVYINTKTFFSYEVQHNYP